MNRVVAGRVPFVAATPSSLPHPPRRPRGRPLGGAAIIDREQALDAATRAITLLGPDATMDDIATAAMVTKPAIYRAVGDKAAITHALSERFVDLINAATADAQRGVTNARGQFRASVYAYLATIQQHRNLFLFVNGSEYGTELFRSLVQRSAHGLVAWLTAVRHRAGLPVEGATAWAYAIVGTLQMSGTMWAQHPERSLDTLSDDLTMLLWDGLGNTVPRS